MRSTPFFTLQQLNDAVAVRHQLHQNPELKFEEADTAKLVAERLQALGYQVTEGIATTGVLAELDEKGSCMPATTMAVVSQWDCMGC